MLDKIFIDCHTYNSNMFDINNFKIYIYIKLILESNNLLKYPQIHIFQIIMAISSLKLFININRGLVIAFYRINGFCQLISMKKKNKSVYPHINNYTT